MRLFTVLACLLLTFSGFAQKGKKVSRVDKTQKPERVELVIREIMDAQEVAWNKGDLQGFMNGYWESDSLRFIGSHGLTYGWKQALENYRKGYPDRDAMGKLKFTILVVDKLSFKSAFVIGKWRLARKNGDLNGYFTLLWKKIKGKWVIVADHTD
ncbi:MAG: nuclear transport factor 2 family protein [Saprospiraceae bacterium]|nr:nuclear transport factor 2 family protein [Saprospiraceae bacterium]